jgi:DNA-binding NtrC family response regulator
MPTRPIAPEAMDLLKQHGWRGNVRELENTMHRAVLIAQGNTIGADAIRLTAAPRGTEAANDTSATAVASTARGALVGRTVADVERDLIIETLTHCLGNRTHAANILGISIRTLRNKLKLYSDQGVRVPAANESARAAI